MTLTKAVQILRDHNTWRRDNSGDVPETDSKLLGQAIDLVCNVAPALLEACVAAEQVDAILPKRTARIIVAAIAKAGGP